MRRTHHLREESRRRGEWVTDMELIIPGREPSREMRKGGRASLKSYSIAALALQEDRIEGGEGGGPRGKDASNSISHQKVRSEARLVTATIFSQPA